MAIYLLLAVAGMAISVMVTVLELKWWAPLGIDDTVGGLATMTLLILAPLAWYALKTGGWRRIGPLLPTAIPGVLLMLALFLPWMIYMRVLFAGAGEVFNEQLTERAAGTGGWSYDSPMKYVGGLFQLTLPWLGLLPGALAVAWTKRFRSQRAALMYLTLWSILFVALLNLSAGKRMHYLLPMLPALSLLMGFAANDLFFSHRWLSARLGKATAIGYAAAGALLLGLTWLVSGIGQDPQSALERLGSLAWIVGGNDKMALLFANFADHAAGWKAIAIAASVSMLPLAVMLVLAIKNRLAPAMGLLTAAIVIVYVGHFAGGQEWDSRSYVQYYAKESLRRTGDRPVYSWGDPQSKLVFYVGRNVPSVLNLLDQLSGGQREKDPQALAQWQEWVKEPANVAYVFCYGKYQEKLAALGYTLEFQVEDRDDRNSPFLLMRNGRLPAEGPP